MSSYMQESTDWSNKYEKYEKRNVPELRELTHPQNPHKWRWGS